MGLQELKKTQIERKAHIDDDDRTPGKDEVADYIETEIVEAGRWPMDVIEIADEVDYSRQHVTNVVKDYFTEAGGEEQEDTTESESAGRGISITIPEHFDKEEEQAFLQGVAEGRRV